MALSLWLRSTLPKYTEMEQNHTETYRNRGPKEQNMGRLGPNSPVHGMIS